MDWYSQQPQWFQIWPPALCNSQHAVTLLCSQYSNYWSFAPVLYLVVITTVLAVRCECVSSCDHCLVFWHWLWINCLLSAWPLPDFGLRPLSNLWYTCLPDVFTFCLLFDFAFDTCVRALLVCFVFNEFPCSTAFACLLNWQRSRCSSQLMHRSCGQWCWSVEVNLLSSV